MEFRIVTLCSRTLLIYQCALLMFISGYFYGKFLQRQPVDKGHVVYAISEIPAGKIVERNDVIQHEISQDRIPGKAIVSVDSVVGKIAEFTFLPGDILSDCFPFYGECKRLIITARAAQDNAHMHDFVSTHSPSIFINNLILEALKKSETPEISAKKHKAFPYEVCILVKILSTESKPIFDCESSTETIALAKIEEVFFQNSRMQKQLEAGEILRCIVPGRSTTQCLSFGGEQEKIDRGARAVWMFNPRYLDGKVYLDGANSPFSFQDFNQYDLERLRSWFQE